MIGSVCKECLEAVVGLLDSQYLLPTPGSDLELLVSVHPARPWDSSATEDKLRRQLVGMLIDDDAGRSDSRPTPAYRCSVSYIRDLSRRYCDLEHDGDGHRSKGNASG